MTHVTGWAGPHFHEDGRGAHGKELSPEVPRKLHPRWAANPAYSHLQLSASKLQAGGSLRRPSMTSRREGGEVGRIWSSQSQQASACLARLHPHWLLAPPDTASSICNARPEPGERTRRPDCHRRRMPHEWRRTAENSERRRNAIFDLRRRGSSARPAYCRRSLPTACFCCYALHLLRKFLRFFQEWEVCRLLEPD